MNALLKICCITILSINSAIIPHDEYTQISYYTPYDQNFDTDPLNPQKCPSLIDVDDESVTEPLPASPDNVLSTSLPESSTKIIKKHSSFSQKQTLEIQTKLNEPQLSSFKKHHNHPAHTLSLTQEQRITLLKNYRSIRRYLDKKN